MTYQHRVHTGTYYYRTEDSRVLFSVRRYERVHEDTGAVREISEYWDPKVGPSEAPDWAGRCLYRLPQLMKAIDAREVVHWTTNERDADALAGVGFYAVCGHRRDDPGSAEQAEWLAAVPLVVLWVYSEPDSGSIDPAEAYTAMERQRLLCAAGVPGYRVTFVTAEFGGGAIDHLASGSRHDLKVLDHSTLSALAAMHNPSEGEVA